MKVKVGRAGDVELVAAVREAVGPDVAIRVDANGAWDVDTVAPMIARLARFDLEFVEQPVADLDDLARCVGGSACRSRPTSASAPSTTPRRSAPSTPPT